MIVDRRGGGIKQRGKHQAGRKTFAIEGQYYTKKITSSINYAKGYNLAVLIDKDLQNIYNLERVYIYNNIDDIDKIFENTLFDFYKKK